MSEEVAKLCTNCKQEKEIAEFCKDIQKKDRLSSSCRLCRRVTSALSYIKNKASIKRRQDSYREENKEVIAARNKVYQATLKGKEVAKRSSARYRKASNKKKIAAVDKVKYALKVAKLTKQSCEVCDVEKTQAHHDDYNKPLDIRWLCCQHHKLWHRENGPGLNGEDKCQVKQ